MIYLIISLLVLTDQITKFLAIEFLKDANPVTFIPNILDLRYIENTGAAFSILEGRSYIFVAITLLVLAFGYRLYKTNQIKHITGKIACVLIASGGIGNLIDRVLHGFVVDMFEFTFMNFAIFNVADIFITLGGAILCIYIILFYDKDMELKHENRN